MDARIFRKFETQAGAVTMCCVNLMVVRWWVEEGNNSDNSAVDAHGVLVAEQQATTKQE